MITINQYVVGAVVGVALALLLHMRGEAHAFAAAKKKKKKHRIRTPAQQQHLRSHRRAASKQHRGDVAAESRPLRTDVRPGGGEHIFHGSNVSGSVIHKIISPRKTRVVKDLYTGQRHRAGYQPGDVIPPLFTPDNLRASSWKYNV